MDCEDPASTTDLDRDYLLADAMIRLLREPPAWENADAVERDLQFYFIQRENRLVELEGRANCHIEARRARTPRWAGA